MKLGKIQFFVVNCLVGCVILAGVGFLWLRMFHHRLPPGMMKDIRAGIAARNIIDPDARLLKYLEGRYGPMTESANRQQVFLDFFDVEHIKVLQLLVKHSPADHRQGNIDAMARWIESYRESLTPEERAAWGVRLQSGEGQAMLKRATAQYNSQDVQYRGSTVPVISQLLRTLNELQRTD